ncbi:cGMP-dependent protein kinase, isozyme 1-like [Onthophagus taurus]|uniref:cGMP-dependent protein kinase, isozyme 1-like n=1 Tax=Onthophagus taurus TaxID=166361 RepID=UPI0039BE7AFC
MPCFKSPSYNLNETGENNRNDETNGRREGIYTGTKMVNLSDFDNIQKHEKTEEEIKNIKSAFSNNNLLKTVLFAHHPQVLDTIIDSMHSKELNDQENLFFERAEGNEMFISSKGIYNVIQNGKKIGIFSDQRVIGELAMFYKSKRPFTIRSVGKSSVWVIDRFTFQTILVHHSSGQENEMLTYLQKVPEFNNLSIENLIKLMTLFEKESILPDTVIVDEENEIKKFYMLNHGWAVSTKNKLGKIRDYHRGDFFGEKSLIQKEIISNTITAKDNGAEFYTLTKAIFQKYFANNSGGNQNSSSLTLENLPIEEKVRNLTLNDFEKVETIGKGGFGKVDIVFNKNNKKEFFALKYINKADVVEFQQFENVFNEKNIQLSLKNNFIVRMLKTFKDKKYLYFLLEPCMGGDLYTLLQKQKNKQFPESSVKFYTACVIEAFDYLHKRNCIYRDLKPENLLIDTKGYVKLTDFGFSKKLTMSKTFTFAGTPEYLAPEIILNTGHDKSIDFWALGVLIFELLSGKTPFETNDSTHLKTYEAILKGIKSIDFPKYFSIESVDVIKNLCAQKPIERLSSPDEIKTQRFFAGFSWINLHSEKMRAPFVPQLTHSLDVRNFDVCKDSYVPPDENGDWAENF